MTERKTSGFTKVENSLLEALAFCQLSGVQMGICLFILRRTAGWGKNEDAISLREFAEATGSSNFYISEQLKKLINYKVIVRFAYEPGKVPSYSINQEISEWDKSIFDYENYGRLVASNIFVSSSLKNTYITNNKNPSANAEGVSVSGTEGFNKSGIDGLCESERVQGDGAREPPGLKALPKERVKKDKETINYSSASLEYNLALLLLNEIKKNLRGFKEPNLQKWAKRYGGHLKAG